MIFLEVSYKKLWKLLIDKDMKKNDIRKIPLSSSTISKLNRGEPPISLPLINDSQPTANYPR